MANIFKAYDRLYQRKKAELEELPEGSSKAEDLEYAVDVLKEIIEYRDSLKWLYKGQSKKRIEVFLKSGYDYVALCETFNIKRTTATSVVNWAGRQFKKKVGENTYELLEQGYVEEALVAFYMGSGQMRTDKFLMSDFAKHMPEAELQFYKLYECKEELKLLEDMSRASVVKRLKAVDKKKLAYLRYLLEGHSKRAELLRPSIIALLQGNYSVDGVVEDEKEVEVKLMNF